MVAAISPASDNFEESLSTLRSSIAQAKKNNKEKLPEGGKKQKGDKKHRPQQVRVRRVNVSVGVVTAVAEQGAGRQRQRHCFSDKAQAGAPI